MATVELSSASHAPASTASMTLSNGSAHAHLKQKRARSQLSCIPCRQGKLKCNREKPVCDQCIKRSRGSTCLYVPPPVKQKPAQNVKGRIRQLENLVVDLMNQNRQAQQEPSPSEPTGSTGDATRHGSDEGDGQPMRTVRPFSQPTPPSDNDTSPQFTDSSGGPPTGGTPPDEDVDAAATPFGQMKISANEISYIGEGHWGAILNSISDLKRDLGDDDEEEEEDEKEKGGRPEAIPNSWGSGAIGGAQAHATTGLGFMLGNSTPLTKEQLIAAVPEKRAADRLLSLWFNSPDPFKPIIHAPTFQDEYRRFWRTPKDTPPMWLGLLFAILSLAASFGLRDNDPRSPQAQAVLADVNRYHSLSASAAVLADFTKPKHHTIECLILYSAGLRSNNAFVNVWLMIGLVVRLALRMGYHRDASHYPAITVFQGEMRRRAWAIISMIDVLISFQLGLPSMVKTIQSDTAAPRNLLDHDFNVSTTVLPAGRGIDELTPSSYTRAKLRVVRIFANASELSHATVPPAYEEMMKLDRELEEAKAFIPPLLQMPDISELVTDSAEQLMCRFNLDLLYLKTKTTLHRRYMLKPYAQLSPEEQQAGIGRSRRICTECALRVLQHHHTIYSASQSGGQLESVKWYMGTISTHDFLLAAMVICLELSSLMNDPTFQGSPSGVDCPRRGDMMTALEKSQRIWSDASGRTRKMMQFTGRDEKEKGEHMFDETEKASRAMAVMLEKVKRQFGTQTQAAGQTPKPTDGTEANATIETPGTRKAWEDMIFKDGEMPESLGQGTNRSPYMGVDSTYDWGSLADIRNFNATALEMGGAPFTTTGPAGSATGIANNPVVFGDGVVGMGLGADSNESSSADSQDFATIGNMLDVNAANLDWQMWDNEFTNAQQIQTSAWSDLQDSMDPDTAFNPESIKPGNAIVAGSGLDVQKDAAEPVENVGFDAYQMSAMDFDMNVPLQDVHLDLGLAADYNKHGMYPTTKAEWEHFEKRQAELPRV